MTQITPANPLLIKVAILIRDIMGVPESQIIIGRQNFPQNDYATGYITVDQLGSATLDSTNEKFDGIDEVMSYNAIYKTEITIEFYGNDAYTNSERLIGLIRSQAAFEKKLLLGIDILHPSSITDLKQLTGQQYGNRLQVSMMAIDNRKVEIDTLRIDTAQYGFLTEQKEIEI